MRNRFVVFAALLMFVATAQAEDKKVKAAVDAFAKQYQGTWTNESELDTDVPSLGKKGDKLTGHLTFRKRAGLIEVSWRGENIGKPVGTRGRGIIGWDVAAEKLRLRWFSTAGASGTVLYSDKGDHWINQSNSIDGDGTKVAADDHVTVPKNDSYTVKQTNRKRGSESLPDRELVWKRSKKSKKSKKPKKPKKPKK